MVPRGVIRGGGDVIPSKRLSGSGIWGSGIDFGRNCIENVTPVEVLKGVALGSVNWLLPKGASLGKEPR